MRDVRAWCVALSGALLLSVGVSAPAVAASFVSLVDITDGVGTVTASLDGGEARQWVTRDGGRTFTRLRVGRELDVYGTVLGNGLGYARVGSSERLWRTTNSGRTWTRTGVRDVFQVTATSTSAWALRSNGRREWLSRSDDGGRTWTTRELRVGNPEWPAVGVDFADAADGVLSGLRPSGKPFVRVTQDGGRTWTGRRSPCLFSDYKSGPDARWLASGTLWLLCTGPGGTGTEALEVHTSTDAGRTFTLRSRAPLPGGGGEAVGGLFGVGHIHGFDPVSDRQAFMSFGYGYTVTTDGGVRWRPLRHLPGQLDGGGSELKVDGKVRYLALGVQGLWRSPDAGATWRRVKLR